MTTKMRDHLLGDRFHQKPVALRDQTTQEVFERQFSLYGGLNAGGLQNPITGAGGNLDKNEGYFYTPTRTHSRYELEVLYVQSWACRSFIDIPVDDMLIKGREFKDADKDFLKRWNDQERIFQTWDRLSRGMKAGRLYGTGLVIPMTVEAPLTKPLDLKKIRPGDLKSILIVDRYDASVMEKSRDPFTLNYDEPELYRVNLDQGGSIDVHASRVFRFDGRKALSSTGWYNYDKDWGVSEILAAIIEINQDAGLARGISHLVQEASIPVVKTPDFEDALKARGGEMSLAQMAEAISQFKSIYRTMFIDADGDFSRISVNFAGLPDLMDCFAKRLAAMAMIPATRFWGQSPIGMNATGESDMMNYALMVNARQEKDLRHPVSDLDLVLMRNLGMSEIPEFSFPPLIDISDKDAADIFNVKATAIAALLSSGAIDEIQAMQILKDDKLAGDLEPRVASFGRLLNGNNQGAASAAEQNPGEPVRRLDQV